MTAVPLRFALTFERSGVRYALPADQIAQISPTGAISPVPGAIPACAGAMIDAHGALALIEPSGKAESAPPKLAVRLRHESCVGLALAADTIHGLGDVTGASPMACEAPTVSLHTVPNR